MQSKNQGTDETCGMTADMERLANKTFLRGNETFNNFSNHS